MQFVLFQHFFSPLQTWIKFCNTSTVQIAVAHSYLRHACYHCNCISVSTWYGSTLTKFETISLSLTHTCTYTRMRAHMLSMAYQNIHWSDHTKLTSGNSKSRLIGIRDFLGYFEIDLGHSERKPGGMKCNTKPEMSIKLPGSTTELTICHIAYAYVLCMLNQ